MSTQQSTVDFLLEQMESAGKVSAKKMFGEYGVYCEGKMVALVCDDELFVKPTTAGREFVGECIEKAPYPGAKPCLLIKAEKWDEREWLSELIRVSAEHLPASKPKAARKK